MKGILGRKVGMTEKFTTDGRVIPGLQWAYPLHALPQAKDQVRRISSPGNRTEMYAA